MARFLTDHLDARQLDGDEWQLLAPVVFEDDDRTVYVAAIGFVTDFASIPWGVRNMFPQSGPWNRAAVIHDWLCVTKPIASPAVHAVFRRALAACGCNPVQRQLMWMAVRTFGPRFDAQPQPSMGVDVSGHAIDGP